MRLTDVLFLTVILLFSWSVGFGMGWTLKQLPSEYGTVLFLSAVFVMLAVFVLFLVLR